MNKENQEIEVTGRLGKIDGIDAIEVEASMDGNVLKTTQFIYKETEKMIIENMPQEILENLHDQTKKELKRRKKNVG